MKLPILCQTIKYLLLPRKHTTENMTLQTRKTSKKICRYTMSDRMWILWQERISYSIKVKKACGGENRFSKSQSSILRLLRKMGFRYRRCNNRSKFLMERRDIVVTLMEFLRAMHYTHSTCDIRLIFYLDKIWVNQNLSLKYNVSQKSIHFRC
jgi:hypothetical protein